jgi:hypothetical protein
MVKRLRHRPFTAVTGVQIPLGSFKRIINTIDVLIIFCYNIEVSDYGDIAKW